MKKKVSKRDPESTRARILAAALKEFAARGFAGARVDAIAARATINKRMLYHYFGDKEELFRAVLRHKIAERQAWAEAAPADPRESLPQLFGLACQDADWIRLLQWEALHAAKGKLIDEPVRRAAAARAVRRVQQRQASGHLPEEHPAEQLQLAMMSLTMFPLAFPQLTRLITGKAADSPRFQNQHAQFLQQFAEAFTPKPTTT